MKHRSVFLSLLALGAVLSGIARGLSLLLAIDSRGLPVTNHPATICLVVLTVLFVLVYLILSAGSPCRGTGHDMLVFSKVQSLLALMGAFLFLFGISLSLTEHFTTVTLVLSLLGWASGICFARLARLRQTGNRTPLPELLPVVYFILRLILNFKNWSTDPIILDYFDPLFALIFTMFALYGSAGFLFGKGQPRQTLFYSAAAILFCTMAAVSSLVNSNFGDAVTFVGCGLWLLPQVQCLLNPSTFPESSEKNQD